MALRIPWDKQETAILIDAYSRVKNNELSQQDAVKEVSALLRRRAIQSGIEIDDIFRNVNGITMQMKIIGGLLDEHPSSLHGASKVFTDMVTLYKSNPASFGEILIQAKGECAVQVNVKERFFTWLSARVSSAHLSEYYIVCKDIESFCMSKRILTEPLFETTNIVVIQGVIDTIKSNRLFRFKYFLQLGKMRKVMDYYMTFLREVPLQQEKVTETVHVTREENRSFSEEYIAPHNLIPLNTTMEQAPVQSDMNDLVSKADSSPIESETNSVEAAYSEDTAEDEVSPEYEAIWNFSNDNLDFSNKFPVAISYFGDKVKVQGWADAFVKIICSMQEDYPSIIRGMVGYRFPSIGKVALTGVAGLDTLSNAAELNNGLYLETNCSPDEIVTIARVLMDKCNMDYDNLEMFYEVFRNTGNDIESLKEDTKTESDESFSDKGVKDYLVEKLDELSIPYVDHRNKKGCLWIIGDYKLSSVFDKFEQFNAVFHYKEDGGRATSGKPAWWTKDIIIIADESPSEIAPKHPDEDGVKKNRIAFIKWAQSQQMQNAAILAYLSDIKKCNEIAKENSYIKEEHILLIENADVLERVFLEMRKDSKFLKLNNERQQRPVSAMNKLIAFRKAAAKDRGREATVSTHIAQVETPVQSPAVPIFDFPVEPQVKERYSAILAEKFVDGFRPAKAIDRDRFKMYYSDMFGEELSEEDERLVQILMNVGTLRDERIFVKDEAEQKDLLEEINDTIIETFKDGASCVFLDCLFARFQEQLAEMLHIYNSDSLERVLFNSKKRNYLKRYNYLFRYDKEPTPSSDVIEYMKKSHLPVTYSEIENALWYVPLDKIKTTLFTTPGIVNVASEAYLYAPNLPVNEREIQQIAELITQSLLQRSYISDVELIRLIEEHCPSVLINTQDYPIWGLRNALAYLLREKFSFRGAIISDKDEEISMAEVFSDFCHSSEHITVDELKQFANDLNTVIYWDSVYGEMVRVNQNEFIRQDQIHFDIEQTDSVLDSLIPNDYTPIKAINLFLHFPTINVPWNNFVLESYVANYSKKFILLHASYTSTDCCGAIVRQESDINDYRTLIVDVLANNTGWKNKKDALQLLVDLGYQQRRSYSDIDKVMQEAKNRMSVLKEKDNQRKSHEQINQNISD